MREFMNITKALSDDNRVRILLALRGQELCVCQIIELLSLAPSTVSKHLSILNQAYLVESRKNGRWVYYHLAGDEAPAVARETIRWATDSLSGNPRMADDAKKLEAILKIDPEQLCKELGQHYCSGRENHAR